MSKPLKEAARLSEEEQNSIASWLLAELRSEQKMIPASGSSSGPMPAISAE